MILPAVMAVEFYSTLLHFFINLDINTHLCKSSSFMCAGILVVESKNALSSCGL
jgi:hypothetical protein